MKEFEKWSKTPTGYAERESDYAEGEAAWRAALEWVIGEHGPLDKRVNNPACARGRIEKELGE